MSTTGPTTGREPIVLVVAADDPYAILMGVALHSALIHLEPGSSVYLYIIDGGISDRNRERLERIVDVANLDLHLRWVVADLGPLADLESGVLGTGAYLRLLIPDIVAERFDKAIYLDSDVQVEVSLSRLWGQPLDDHAVLAVQDFVSPFVSSPGAVTNYTEFGYDPDTPYFNSGVLMLNLTRWRSEAISQQVIQAARDYEQFVQFADQYGLNVVLADDWGMLDPKWNVMTIIPTAREDIRSTQEELLNYGYIYHFTGYKPWQHECTHPARHQWRRYLDESLWFDPGERKDPIVVTKLDQPHEHTDRLNR